MTKRIYFYSPSFDYDKSILVINTTPLYIDGHLQNYHHDLWKSISWKKVQLHPRTQKQLINEIEQLEIDILCVSLYVWNHAQIMDAIQGIKNLVQREITVIAGGPSVNVYRDHSYLHQYPDIDFAVYAQGEEAFASILQVLNGTKKLGVFETKNMAWRDKDNKFRIAEFEFIRKTSGSHYIEGRHILEQIVADPDNKGFIFELPYEASKGCPYDCVYCDWTSGLSHKVSRRKFAWEQELELLGEMGILRLNFSDANFGIFKDDIEIVRAMVRLKKERGFDFKVNVVNFAKLHKKTAFEILEVMVKAEIIGQFFFGVQDINPAVLELSQRPDVPWKEHRGYIDAFKRRHPEIDFYLELITGLPGQTRDSWERTLIETFPYKIRCYPWVLLPNSPASYDEECKQKLQIKVATGNLLSVMDHQSSYLGDVVVGTLSYNETDYAYFLLLNQLMINPKLRRIIDQQQFFKSIRSSKYLEQYLEKIQKCFQNTLQIHDLTFEFLNLLISEIKDWPVETARILIWWKTGKKHPDIIDDDLELLNKFIAV